MLESLDSRSSFVTHIDNVARPWENGYIESFNGKFRDEFLNRELLDTVLEAKVLTQRWRKHYNTVRPHSALGYRPPAPEAFQPFGLDSEARTAYRVLT